jgi:taurine dioxygenase
METVAYSLCASGQVLGDVVEGLDLSEEVDSESFRQLDRDFNERGLLIVRSGPLTHDQHIRFSRNFGELEIHVVRQFRVLGFPELFRVSNLLENGERIGASAEYWHTDLSYLAIPARCSLLYGTEIPADSDGTPRGDTLFASTYAAYEGLSYAMKKRLEGLKGIHRFVNVYDREKQRREAAGLPPMTGGKQTLMSDKEIMAATPEVVHPVVRTHPFTGRKCLYVNQGFTVGIEGMPDDEGNDLLNELFEHTVRPEYTYCHHWRVGDLVIWDNCSTVHKAAGNYGPEHRRLLFRTTVKGTSPF